MLSAMLPRDMEADEKSLCFQLLRGIDIKFSALWQSYKGMPFGEIIKLSTQ